jgi:hypothetical protein
VKCTMRSSEVAGIVGVVIIVEGEDSFSDPV